MGKIMTLRGLFSVLYLLMLLQICYCPGHSGGQHVYRFFHDPNITKIQGSKAGGENKRSHNPQWGSVPIGHPYCFHSKPQLPQGFRRDVGLDDVWINCPCLSWSNRSLRLQKSLSVAEALRHICMSCCVSGRYCQKSMLISLHAELWFCATSNHPGIDFTPLIFSRALGSENLFTHRNLQKPPMHLKAFWCITLT